MQQAFYIETAGMTGAQAAKHAESIMVAGEVNKEEFYDGGSTSLLMFGVTAASTRPASRP
jgi:hypothetical protein